MSFDTAIARVLGIEGGLVDNPNDPGGLTQWGISQRAYPHLDIRALTRDQAVEIYRTDFWIAVHADTLPPVLAYQALDFAVNSGVSTAIRKLQHAAGVADDGHWGPVSQAAVLECNRAVLTLLFLAERQEFMTGLKNWQDAGRGWARRIATDMRYAAQDLGNPTLPPIG